MDRPATQLEIDVIRWLLDHAIVDGAASYRQLPLDELRVVEECSCGCASVHFQAEPGRLEMIADAISKGNSAAPSNLILWGRAGRIVWLEVYDPAESRQLPAVETLCLWDQLYEVS